METITSLLQKADSMPLQTGRKVDYSRPCEDPGIIAISSCWPEVQSVVTSIPIESVLEATRALEIQLFQKTVTNGFKPRVCGNSKGLIEDKEDFGHVLEHALIAVFNNNVPISEACSGGRTDLIGEGLPDFDIFIAIPPSIQQITAEKETKYILLQMESLYKKTGRVNLAEIRINPV